MLAPYFFYKTRVQISSTDFCTLFFSFAPPRIAQERRLGFKSVVSPVKRLNALRAAYGLLSRFVKSGAFAMTVWIAMPQPIAANFHCASAILTEALPAGFIASDSCVLYRLNHFEKTKGLVCKVVLDLDWEQPQDLVLSLRRLSESTDTIFPHSHSQIHFALPGSASGSFCITVSFPNVLLFRSMRVGDCWCRRHPHDFVPFFFNKLVEEITAVLPHSHWHSHIGRPGFLSSTLFTTVSISNVRPVRSISFPI